jgi:hypothetical protein
MYTGISWTHTYVFNLFPERPERLTGIKRNYNSDLSYIVNDDTQKSKFILCFCSGIRAHKLIVWTNTIILYLPVALKVSVYNLTLVKISSQTFSWSSVLLYRILRILKNCKLGYTL